MSKSFQKFLIYAREGDDEKRFVSGKLWTSKRAHVATAMAWILQAVCLPLLSLWRLLPVGITGTIWSAVLWQWPSPPLKPLHQASLRRIHPVPGGHQYTQWSTTRLQDTPQFRTGGAWSRCLDKKEMGQHIDELVHYMLGESDVFFLFFRHDSRAK